jgi:hypothetical protein
MDQIDNNKMNYDPKQAQLAKQKQEYNILTKRDARTKENTIKRIYDP